VTGVALPPLDVAVVFGSGLAVVPDGLTVEAELGYEELGWPVSGVGGHASRLLVARRDALRVGLAWGRPHLYEGWTREELERPVRDLCAAGATRVVLTNSCGSLRPSVKPGDALIAVEVVDLQEAPLEEPDRLVVTSARRAGALCAVLTAHLPARVGAYVAVPGPQYETPAEVAWLATYGDVVGMSTAPEVRAARACGCEVELIALVVNRAAAVGEHGDVLEAANRFETALRAVLGTIVAGLPPDAAESGVLPPDALPPDTDLLPRQVPPPSPSDPDNPR
jgi:purine-nucleoside phosphorylase